ncbi:hypothetical protein VTL71DRAFT_15940 [Oculimacula yallundae]|uniref:Mitochondrial import inner membrane translocase subunit TIM50 n=1 Tax=Oculimacula yallundae TaxID=86028 RepID=A0ABR4CDT3_9HELO
MMNPKADSFQPTSPALETQLAQKQRDSNSNSADGIDAVVQSLQGISLKTRKATGTAAKSSLQTLPTSTISRYPPSTSSKSPKNNPRQKPPKQVKHRGRMNDTITPPSPESGGTPEPSAAYLAASLEPLQYLTEAQHLLVVIDLNGTLLFRPNKRAPSKFIARPNTARFLRYCVDTFSVVVWSSARPENVKLMCDAILDRDLRRKVVAIWAREKFGLSAADYNARTQCYKRLTKLWDDPKVEGSHPGYENGARWDHTNTVLVDDSPEKGRSEPFNMISIPEFEGDKHELGDILPQVHDYLNNLSMHSNVAAYLRAHPFKAALAAAGPPIQYHS